MSRGTEGNRREQTKTQGSGHTGTRTHGHAGGHRDQRTRDIGAMSIIRFLSASLRRPIPETPVPFVSAEVREGLYPFNHTNSEKGGVGGDVVGVNGA